LNQELSQAAKWKSAAGGHYISARRRENLYIDLELAWGEV
jgi:hypothetical protein